MSKKKVKASGPGIPVVILSTGSLDAYRDRYFCIEVRGAIQLPNQPVPWHRELHYVEKVLKTALEEAGIDAVFTISSARYH